MAMNWYCYAIYNERGKPAYHVAEQEDVTELETFRLKERLMVNPQDHDALRFFSVRDEFREAVIKQP